MMKILKTISGGLLVATMLLCFPLGSEAARGCGEQDEERWEQMKAELPTADGMKVRAIIYDLTKLKDKCDPKTRFSASVVRTLIAANFRQAELDEAQGRSRRYIDFRRMQR
ncbi:MAG TPA: hypothetical protein VLL94_13950 [Nitrospiraceae bacterium]|jgi:hypothetical protein|nr:hypothetical protein [Nitrospiraceae bacterium]